MWYGYETGLSPVMSYAHSFLSSHKFNGLSLCSPQKNTTILINSLVKPADSEGFAPSSEKWRGSLTAVRHKQKCTVGCGAIWFSWIQPGQVNRILISHGWLCNTQSGSRRTQSAVSSSRHVLSDMEKNGERHFLREGFFTGNLFTRLYFPAGFSYLTVKH